MGAGGGAAAAVAGAPVFLRPLKDAAVSTGSDVRLRVVVSGTPQPSLQLVPGWAALAPAGPRAQLPVAAELQAAGCAGVYSCRAQNRRGQASCEAVLTVLEVGGNAEVGAKPGGRGVLIGRELPWPPLRGGGICSSSLFLGALASQAC